MNAVAQLRAPTLAELVQRAVTASEIFAQVGPGATTHHFNYWERAAGDARDDLYAALEAFGISKALASKMGGVL